MSYPSSTLDADHRDSQHPQSPQHTQNPLHVTIDALDKLVTALAAHSHLKRFLTANEVAALYSVHPDWVRKNAHALGGVRMSNGPKGRLRFSVREVDAYFAGLAEPAPAPKRARKRRSGCPTDDAPMLVARPVPRLA